MTIDDDGVPGVAWQYVTGKYRYDMTDRLPVPGGWLYRVTSYPQPYSRNTVVNVVFVPFTDDC